MASKHDDAVQKAQHLKQRAEEMAQQTLEKGDVELNEFAEDIEQQAHKVVEAVKEAFEPDNKK